MKVFSRVVLITIILLFVVGLARGRAQLFLFGNPLEGKRAPDFTLSTLTNNAVAMSVYRDGQPAIIFFWATWCPHCRTALQELSARQGEIEAQGIKIILVDAGESKSQVAQYVRQHNINLDVFLDIDTHISGDYSVLGVPTFVLIDKEGIIKSVKHVLPADYQTLLLK